MYKSLRTQLLLPLLFLILTFSCSNEESTQLEEEAFGNEVIPAVEAVQARYGSLPLVERFSGNVRSENQVPLFSQISAKVEAVFVENGDFVTKGQKLAQLEDVQFQQQLIQAEAGLNINKARLKQAEARYSELSSRFNRTKKLADKDLSSDSELEQLQSQLVSAEADVELAKAQLDQSESLVKERRETLKRTIISAPITGTIGQRNIQVGMQVNQSTQLFMLGDLSRLRVEIVLTENMLNKISIGQSAHILVNDYEGNEQIVEAKLSRISPFLNEITRSTEAEIDVENTNGWLKPGMFVPVDINFGESQQATLVPVSALYTDPSSGAQGVFIASSLGSEIQPVDSEDGDSNALQALTEPTKVTFKPINIIAQGRMEVGVGELNSGDWVITIGQDLLNEGKDQARIRTVSWDKVIALQRLQPEDLLKEVLKKQALQATTSTL